MLLNRTEIAFERWSANALFLEAEIIAKSNQKIRDALLEKGHLIPPELLFDDSKLIEHYDIWLEQYYENRIKKDPSQQNPIRRMSFPPPIGQEFSGMFQALLVRFVKNSQHRLEIGRISSKIIIYLMD